MVLGYTAAKKFKMSEFNGMAIAFALVYPTMVALTSGEVVGSVELGFAGTFSWYTTFLGLPLIMPASGYTSSVIPILLMVWFGSTLEHWVKKWMPASMKMFFTPLIVVTVTVTLGYLVIGPIATLITNLLGEFFALLFGLPMIGSLLGCTLVGAFWMCRLLPLPLVARAHRAGQPVHSGPRLHPWSPSSPTPSRWAPCSLPCISRTRTRSSAASHCRP